MKDDSSKCASCDKEFYPFDKAQKTCIGCGIIPIPVLEHKTVEAYEVIPGDYKLFSTEDSKRVEYFMNHMFENDPISKAVIDITFARYLNGVMFGTLVSCLVCDRVYNSNNPGYSDCVSCCAMECGKP